MSRDPTARLGVSGGLWGLAALQGLCPPLALCKQRELVWTQPAAWHGAQASSRGHYLNPLPVEGLCGPWVFWG